MSIEEWGDPGKDTERDGRGKRTQLSVASKMMGEQVHSAAYMFPLGGPHDA